MSARIPKVLASIAVVGAISVPAVAQARHGSDDPPSHVRREDHRIGHDARHRADDGPRHERHHRRGHDDGPNHR